MKKTFLRVAAVSFLPAAIAVSLVPTFKSASALSAQVGFNKISGIDFTSDDMITHEKDAAKSVEVGNLHYFDFNGDLLSIVDEGDAKSGKACLVASATDYPRTRFDCVEENRLYQVSYKIKMTDETKFVDSFGISPYLNFTACNEAGATENDKGFDFHRNYADVVYSYSENSKLTSFYFDSVVKNNKLKVRLFDTYENAKAENEMDSYTFKTVGNNKLDYFDIAFYMQGGSKNMSYEIYDFELSVFGTTAPKKVWSLNMDDPIVADAISTSAADNPGKIAVNGKDNFLSVVDDGEASGGKAVRVANSTDYPRLRLNDAIVKEGAYEFSYDLKMIDEDKFDSSWVMSPYIEFTAYSQTEQDWNNPGGIDFNCGYRDVKYAFNPNYFTVSFVWNTYVDNDALKIDLYASRADYYAGTVAQTINFPSSYTTLAAFDMAFYKQGGTTQMGYNIANVGLQALNGNVISYDLTTSQKFAIPVQVCDFSNPENVIVDATSTSAADNPGKIAVNGKDGFLSTIEDTHDKSGTALFVKDSTDYPRIRFNNFTVDRTYKISYDLKMVDENKFDSSWVMSPYLDFTAYSESEQDWNNPGGIDFNCGYKDVKYAFSSKYFTIEFYVRAEVINNHLEVKLFADAISMVADLASNTIVFPETYTSLACVDMALYKQGATTAMGYRVANLGVFTRCECDDDHADANNDSYCDYCGTQISIPVTSISLSSEAAELDLYGNKTATLVVTFEPEEASDKTIIWSSSDESVATVSEGVVTAIKVGTAVITAESSNGKTATCTITVIDTTPEAPIDDDDSNGESTNKKGGCRGDIITCSSVITAIAVAGLILASKKRKEN